MNRSSKESRNGSTRSSSSLLLQQMKARVAGGMGRDGGDEGLDLFSRNRRSLPVVSASAEKESDARNAPPKLGSISAGPVKPPRSEVDDFLSNADMGKNDYDWLLTPPGTPLRSTLEAKEHQLPSVAPRSNSPGRSTSTTKASRFSASQAENGSSTKPTRSSSVTRPSVSATYSNFSANNNKTSVLNTSTSSINSYRPSTPGKRATAVPGTRQTTAPTSRPTSTRSSTPVKVHPVPSSAVEKSRPLHGTRPSTPTARPQISANLNSNTNSNTVVARPSSRPSTPTRRTSAPSSAPVSTRPSTPTRRTPAPSAAVSARPSTPTRRTAAPPSATVSTRPSTPTRRTPAPSSAPVSTRPSTPTRRTPAPSAPVHTRSSSVGRVPTTNNRNTSSSSRPSSPNARVRPLAQPLALPDFSLDAPPNLRTKLPDRPASAGRARPGAALTTRVNLHSEAPTPANPTRRQSSPVVARGRLPENPPKAKLHSNGHETTLSETQKTVVSDGTIRKSAKPTAVPESTGFGRTISKKSLDMALRHMDIRQGMGGIRGTSLFPQSIRSTALRGRPAQKSDPIHPTSRDGTDTEDNDCGVSISGSYNGGISENGDSITTSPDREFLMKRSSEPDVYESSRYDAILLKEDTKSMNWLHSIEDKSDQSPVFDHRFEPLPEPFALP